MKNKIDESKLYPCGNVGLIKTNCIAFQCKRCGWNPEVRQARDKAISEGKMRLEANGTLCLHSEDVEYEN